MCISPNFNREKNDDEYKCKRFLPQTKQLNSALLNTDYTGSAQDTSF